jgi:hypothetical protein
MSKEIYTDKEIARLVRSVEIEVPPALDGRIRAIAANPRNSHGRSLIRRFWYLVLIPTAAALLAVALIRPALHQTAASQISEIRTEFELVDQNIKVIFIQKPDFHLYEEDVNE